MSMASTSKITITADTLCFVFLLFMLNMAYSCLNLRQDHSGYSGRHCQLQIADRAIHSNNFGL